MHTSSPQPSPPALARVVFRNIRALLTARTQQERMKSLDARLADGITAFVGSMRWVYLHVLLFGGWIVLNSGAFHVRPWDPFPFVMLAMIASVEAIFLTSFVLISQNRMSALQERRAELDLQISLLSEHEITRVIEMLDDIRERLGVPKRDPEVDELKRDVMPEAVLDQIEAEERAAEREAS